MAYNYITQHNSPNFTGGRGGKKIEFIIIHWWDDPNKNPSFEGVISTLNNPSRQASAHFVATGINRRVACLVNLPDTAWHAGNFDANQRSIGIECDPRCRDEDYDVVAELVCELRGIYGNLPLRRHSEFSSTQCPGNYDLSRIDRESKNKVYNGAFGKTTNKVQAPVTLPIPDPIKYEKPQIFTMNFDGVNLWKLDTNPNYVSAKTFKKGEEFEAYGYIPFNNTKYIVTKWTFDRKIPNGVNIGDVTNQTEIREEQARLEQERLQKELDRMAAEEKARLEALRIKTEQEAREAEEARIEAEIQAEKARLELEAERKRLEDEEKKQDKFNELMKELQKENNLTETETLQDKLKSLIDQLIRLIRSLIDKLKL